MLSKIIATSHPPNLSTSGNGLGLRFGTSILLGKGINETASATYGLLQNAPGLQLAREQTPCRSGPELLSGMEQRLVFQTQCIWIRLPRPQMSIHHHHLSGASSLCTEGLAH